MHLLEIADHRMHVLALDGHATQAAACLVPRISCHRHHAVLYHCVSQSSPWGPIQFEVLY